MRRLDDASVDFECAACGRKWSMPVGPGMYFVKRRPLRDRPQQYYKTICSCGADCVTYVDARVEPTGIKPTKVLKIDGEEYRVHGRDRNVYPADLKEVIAEANRKLGLDEDENG